MFRASIMTVFLRPAAALLALGLVAACAEGATIEATAAPSPAVEGCLRDVANLTNNGQFKVIDTLESEAGTQVTVGVGPDRAPWLCIGYSDGTTAGIMSRTEEGSL
jgi:hypothetical protein